MPDELVAVRQRQAHQPGSPAAPSGSTAACGSFSASATDWAGRGLGVRPDLQAAPQVGEGGVGVVAAGRT